MQPYSQIISECLNAVVTGPFIPEEEFHTLFGLYRNEVREISEKWPNVDTEDEMVILAINNSFNNLLGYPIDHPEKWNDFISVSPEQLEEVFKSWRKQHFS